MDTIIIDFKYFAKYLLVNGKKHKSMKFDSCLEATIVLLKYFPEVIRTGETSWRLKKTLP